MLFTGPLSCFYPISYMYYLRDLEKSDAYLSNIDPEEMDD